MTAERWNSNLHAFEGLLDIVPTGATRGLDVGCGEGETSRRLRKRVPSVMGLDTDASSIELARQAGDDLDYVVGDLFAVRRHTFFKDVWHTTAPQVWPPAMTYAETRQASIEALPGAAFERVPYFRYTITWTRPQR